MIIVNGFQPLTIITKRFIFDVAAALRSVPESYVMKMYCQCIITLGYTFQSQKFEKFTKIHLNKKTLRSSVTHFKKQPLEVFYKKTVYKNLQHLPQKHLCWSLFLINLQTLRPAALLKRLQHRFFLGILQNL